MKLESLKSRVNNEKGSKIKGKITKSTITFSENKPNFVNPEIGVSSFETSKYEILPAGSGEKTNPNKPDSNPIKANFGPIIRHIKAKQSQIKPNFILDVSSLGFLSGDTNPISNQVYANVDLLLLRGFPSSVAGQRAKAPSEPGRPWLLHRSG